jgi:hypothetical protein
MVYLPLPEETGHTPTEKYVHGPEILAHCQRIAKQFGLGGDALFHTEVTGLAWDEARTRWVIATSRGDRLTAQSWVLHGRAVAGRRGRMGGAAAVRAGQHDRRAGLHAGLLQQRGPGRGAFLGRGYPYGPSAYFAYIDKWHAAGTFDGLEFR